MVIGPNADIIPTGGGSGFVTPYSVVSLYDGMVQLKGGRQIELLSDSILYKDMSQQIYTDGSLRKTVLRANIIILVILPENSFKLP